MASLVLALFCRRNGDSQLGKSSSECHFSRGVPRGGTPPPLYQIHRGDDHQVRLCHSCGHCPGMDDVGLCGGRNFPSLFCGGHSECSREYLTRKKQSSATSPDPKNRRLRIHERDFAGRSMTKCSRVGCAAPAVILLDWRNAKLHAPDRAKTWGSCQVHVEFFRQYLQSRSLYLGERTVSS